MRLGISTHIFARETLRGEHLDRIAAAGFSTVEIFANSHQVDFDNGEHLREIESAVNRNNLMVNSVHAPFYRSLEAIQSGEHLNIASENPDERSFSVQEIARSLVLATLFEVDYYVLHFPHEGHTPSLLKSLEHLMNLARDLNVRLCFENIPGTGSCTPDVLGFLEQNKIPMGFCFDIGHSHLLGRSLDDIRDHGVDFHTTHIHDNDGVGDTHHLPFEGTIDWQSCMDAFRQADYKWGFILEVRNHDEQPVDTFLNRCREAGEQCLAPGDG